MQYNAPYGVSDPNAPYINGNPSTGTMGSIPPAASIEYPQRELVNLISDAGITPTAQKDITALMQLQESVDSATIGGRGEIGRRSRLQLECPRGNSRSRTAQIRGKLMAQAEANPEPSLARGRCRD